MDYYKNQVYSIVMNSKQQIELQKYFSKSRLDSYLPNETVSKTVSIIQEEYQALQKIL